MIIHVPDNVALEVPDLLVRNLIDLHQDRAMPWLSALPALLEQVLADLGATLLPDLPELSYHLVVFAESTRVGHIAIKCTVPNDDFTQESYAAVAMVDAAGPRVRKLDVERGVIVLERIEPGASLAALKLSERDDKAAASVLATRAIDIHQNTSVQAATPHLPDIRQWLKALDAVPHNHPLWQSQQDLIHRARTQSDLLLAINSPPVVLHGDLHHGNVLLDGSQRWRPIDAHGGIGPAEFDVGQHLLNPEGVGEAPDLEGLLRQRLMIWAQTTGSEISQLQGWGFVNAVLSACWTAEDHDTGWEPAVRIAGILERLRFS